MNYHSLSDFRVAHAAVLDRLLGGGVAVLVAQGVVALDVLAQDGLRVRVAAGAGLFRRRERLVELAAATARVEQLRGELDADPAAGDRRQRAWAFSPRACPVGQQRAAREGEEPVKAALDRTSELEAERTRREKTNKAEVGRQKAPRASTTNAEARAMKLADGGFTKNDDIEWAHANGIRLWCPPVHSKHRTDPYAPRSGDQPGKALYEQCRMPQCLGAPHGAQTAVGARQRQGPRRAAVVRARPQHAAGFCVAAARHASGNLR